jgi:hypothetical protein
MQAAKRQCKGATRRRKLQFARDREDDIGGAARRELLQLGVDTGVSCRRLAAQWASVAMPRLFSGRLLRRRCRGSYFSLLDLAVLQRRDLRRVSNSTECPRIKTRLSQVVRGLSFSGSPK